MSVREVVKNYTAKHLDIYQPSIKKLHVATDIKIHATVLIRVARVPPAIRPNLNISHFYVLNYVNIYIYIYIYMLYIHSSIVHTLFISIYTVHVVHHHANTYDSV